MLQGRDIPSSVSSSALVFTSHLTKRVDMFWLGASFHRLAASHSDLASALCAGCCCHYVNLKTVKIPSGVILFVSLFVRPVIDRSSVRGCFPCLSLSACWGRAPSPSLTPNNNEPVHKNK